PHFFFPLINSTFPHFLHNSSTMFRRVCMICMTVIAAAIIIFFFVYSKLSKILMFKEAASVSASSQCNTCGGATYGEMHFGAGGRPFIGYAPPPLF
ncbi:hypothetical protein VIGAN_03014900, partial [Vigna angularis var. angularis]